MADKLADTDREKALETALSTIEKQFGKGSLMRLGDDAAQQIPAISTGALSLDLALGIGGVPRGRVVELYGPESSGKCLTADTHVWTDHGLETIEEVFARFGQKASASSRITDISERGFRMTNERGELEAVTHLTHNFKRPVTRLVTRTGREVKATANHPLRVMDESGFIVWRKVGDIREGDVLVSALFGADQSVGSDADPLTEDEAVFLGYLVAEGTLGVTARNAVVFSNGDQQVVDEYTELCEGLFDRTPVKYGDVDYRIHDKALRQRLADEYGVGFTNAEGKTVPYRIRTAGPKLQAAFLSALYEGDGYIEPKGAICLTLASEEACRQVQLMLFGLGIPAALYTKWNKEYERNYWTVSVSSGAAQRFLDVVGFRSDRRAAQVARHLRADPREPQVENIPHLAGLLRQFRDTVEGDRALDRLVSDVLGGQQVNVSRSRLAAIIQWADAQGSLDDTARTLLAHFRNLAEAAYTYEPVVAVEDAGIQPTFDVVVPETHSFIANGVLSHNTSLALHIIAEAQKAGGIAAFIDAEHALDPTYAKAIGVDINELLVSQPDTGEQALEIMDMLVRSGAVDIVVIDSVAALTPRAEIEGEMGDSHVGLQARLMSQAMRKLAGSLKRSNTSAIFINQIREKIGVMFGSPETTPGGRALKFYSSVRMDIRRIETLKDGSDAVGNRVRVKVKKNKCVAAGARVYDPTTGLTHAIEDIVDAGKGVSVWATDKRGRFHIKQIGARLNQGEQEVIGLRLRDGTELSVTPDHKILTESGWRQAGELAVGDRVARPRRVGDFGAEEPVPPAHARMLGYLIGDGYVGGKTPIAFINASESLHEDASQIAADLGCKTNRRNDGLEAAFSHRPGEKNGLLELARWAGIYGHLAWEKKVPAQLLAPNISHDVVTNLLFGIWESDGWISREQTGGVRCGFVTTSEQLAHQLQWLLLRVGIVSSMSAHEPGSRRSLIDGRRVESKRTCWQVRVSGIDNVHRFAASLPMWGPRGQTLTETLGDPALAKHRGSRAVYLPSTVTEPVLTYLRDLGLTPARVAALVGEDAGDPQGGLKQVLGTPRLRRDRVACLANALDSQYLFDLLEEEVYYDRIYEITPPRLASTYDIEVDELHNFVADGVVVHNCAPPFKQAEFDILYGEGISKEGSMLDMGVDHGIIRKAGAWYSYEDEQIGQGRENARQFLKENDDIAREIEKKIKEELGIAPLAAEADGDPGDDQDADDSEE